MEDFRAMKKFSLILTIILLSVFVFSLATSSAASFKVGFVDMVRVYKEHPLSEKIVQLNNKLQEEFRKRQIQLNQAGKGKTPEEIKALEEKYNKEWTPIKEKILAQIKDLENQRKKSIIDAIRTVAKKLKLSLVLRSEVNIPLNKGGALDYPIVLYGGLDITEQVIVEINKTKKK